MLRAGFDYSWSEASFAAADENGTILFEEFIQLPPRNASGLPEWMNGCLKRQNRTLNDVTEWSVGIGPGSFTGLRLASSFVMGLAFQRPEVRCRGISTASAMAGSAGIQDGRVLALFDGRRNEILAFGLKRNGNSYEPDSFHAVLGGDSIGELDAFDSFVAFSKDEVPIRSILGDSCRGKLHVIEHLNASSLIFASPGNFSTTLKDLVYLRPAVFVEPRIPRQL